MSTDFPGAIDDFTNPVASDPLTAPSHASQHSDVNDAIEAIETHILEAFAPYTPTVSNGGDATFSVRTGWHHKIGKMVFFNAYFVVGVDGTGAGLVSITTPTTPNRTTQQAVFGQVSDFGSCSMVTLVGGSGATWERTRSSTGANLVGTDLNANQLWSFQGWYREA